jgi:DNA helicase-2/ATP-dependent DNA helicase PcrA
VTFTNKAAKEMLARLSAMLPINTRGMWIGTFHGLCNRLLRAHHREAGLPQTFQILDSADQLSAIKRLLKNLNVDDEKFPPRELATSSTRTRSRASAPRRPRPGTTTRSARRALRRVRGPVPARRRGRFRRTAAALLRAAAAQRAAAPHYQERFRHILVDEFQDTNRCSTPG